MLIWDEWNQPPDEVRRIEHADVRTWTGCMNSMAARASATHCYPRVARRMAGATLAAGAFRTRDPN